MVALDCETRLWTDGQGVRFGITIDPQIGWLSSEAKDISSESNKMGMNIGLVMDRFFTKNYAITSGISINNVGGSLKYMNAEQLKGSSGTLDITENSIAEYKIQYVTIPLGLKLHTNEIGYMRYFAELGFDGHVNIKSRLDSDDNNFTNESISESTALFNAGYFIGGGAQYSLGGNSAIFVGIT